MSWHLEVRPPQPGHAPAEEPAPDRPIVVRVDYGAALIGLLFLGLLAFMVAFVLDDTGVVRIPLFHGSSLFSEPSSPIRRHR